MLTLMYFIIAVVLLYLLFDFTVKNTFGQFLFSGDGAAGPTVYCLTGHLTIDQQGARH